MIELQGEIVESTVIVGDFNTPFFKMDRCSKQKISKGITELKNSISQVDIDYFIQQEQNIHFLSTYGTFNKVDIFWAMETYFKT